MRLRAMPGRRGALMLDVRATLKDKRPNIGPAAWRHQNRDALNEAHMPFDFGLFLPFFFVAITPLLAFDAPYPSKQ
jgi:hypothetical protein